mgnify:CR=1 FL=1
MIHSVAVLGAGAVGSYVIWGISSLDDVELGVIAEGERAERLKKNGCAINGKTYHPEVWTPDEAHDVDLMVIALKYGSLEGALESIQKVTGEHTVIMSLMNGVDSEEIIGRTVGMEHVLPALIKVASHKEEDGYHFDPPTTLRRTVRAVRQRAGESSGRVICRYRDSFPLYRVYSGRDLVQVLPECVQQFAAGDSGSRRWMLP